MFIYMWWWWWCLSWYHINNSYGTDHWIHHNMEFIVIHHIIHHIGLVFACLIFDGWCINYIEEFIIIITDIIMFVIIIIYVWIPLSSSFYIYHFNDFNFHVSSLHYYRVDVQLSCGPVWRVDWKSYVLYWSTVLIWELRMR